MAYRAGHDSTQRWCLGHRETGTRPLTENEFHSLRRESATMLLTALVPPAAYLVVCGLFIGASFVLPGRPDLSDPTMQSIAMALLLLGLPVTILLCRDCLKASQDARRDAAEGIALCFGGAAAGDAEGGDRALDPGVVLRSPSLRVLHGPVDVVGHVARVVRVAAGAERGWRIPTTLPNGMAAERRRLSADELDELRTAIRQWLSLRLSSVVAAGWLALVGFSFAHRSPGPVRFEDTFGAALSFVACPLVIWQNVRRIMNAVAMKQDLREGYAYTVHLEQEAEASAQDSEPAAEEPQGTAEFLPHSRVLWNMNGAPAGWRDLGERSTGWKSAEYRDAARD